MCVSYRPVCDGSKTQSYSSKSSFEVLVSSLVPPPLVVVLNYLIFAHTDDTCLFLEFVGVTILEIHGVEVVIFGFVKVGQVPENADVFKSEIVPVVVVRVVWDFVIVDVFSFSEGALNLYQLPRVKLVRSHPLVTEIGWDPPTVDDDRCTLNFDGISLIEKLFERNFTSFITVKWIYDIKAWSSIFSFRQQYFFGIIKLTDHEVRLESMVHIVLFDRHSPPGPIEGFPRSNVFNHMGEPIVSFRS